MNGLLLDTNIPSELTHSRPDENVRAWFTAQPAASLFLSVITIGELRRGFASLPLGKRRADLERWFEQSLTPAFQSRVLPELLGVPVSVLTPEFLPVKFRDRVLQKAEPL